MAVGPKDHCIRATKFTSKAKIWTFRRKPEALATSAKKSQILETTPGQPLESEGMG